MKLWRRTQRLDGNAKWGVLATADVATITLENQKNGQKGYTLHHHKTANLNMCPVIAMARLVYAVQGRSQSTPIGSFWDAQGQPGRITAAELRAAVRVLVDLDGLEAK